MVSRSNNVEDEFLFSTLMHACFDFLGQKDTCCSDFYPQFRDFAEPYLHYC